MDQPVFKQALSQLQQQGAGADSALSLKKALFGYDPEACWNLICGRLPGEPGGHSQKNYFSALKDLLGWAEREQQSLLTPVDHFGSDYLYHLTEKYGASRASINTRLSQARRFYKVFRQLGVVGVNLDPFSILERSQVIPGEHRAYYSAEEISRLLAQATLSERAMLLLGCEAGLSTAELLGLKWPDLLLPAGTIQLSRRQVPISPALSRVLAPFSEQQGGGVLFSRAAPVFELPDQNALRAGVYLLCLKANVPYRAWRGLRHAAGVRFFRQTGNLEQVARLMGVENVHLVRMYQEVARPPVNGQPMTGQPDT